MKKNSQKPSDPAIRMVMMPRDTNPLGSIFGGHILSLIDQAAGQCARGLFAKKFVTKIMREVEFIAPVYVGDTVSFYAECRKIGTTSITVGVDVIARRDVDSTLCESVTSAEVVMVAIDKSGSPTPIKD